MVGERVKSRIDRRIASLRDFVTKEVNTVFSGKAVNGVGDGVGDLASLKPVQGATKVVEGFSDQATGAVQGTVKNITGLVREQAQITRELAP